jgi:hypothetical protein
VIARATTTISITRGETADGYGDATPNNSPLYQKVPASIIEQTRRVFTYDSPTPRTVRYYIGRVGAGTDIRNNDTILDEQTGVTYLVDDFSQPSNPTRAVDIKLDLRLTN